MRSRAELHLHSDFSLLDGFGKIPDYVAEAKRKNVVALALTDHGNLSGAFEHYTECRKAEVEPLIGLEAYFVEDIAAARQARQADDEATRYHVGIIAKGERGYRVLKELNDEAHANFYYKPLVDRIMLESLGRGLEDLVILSGCANSIISRKVLTAPGLAAEELSWWQALFPNFYIELQHHDCAFDTDLCLGLLQLAVDNGVQVVITNDCHYVKKEDASTHDALLAIQTASNIDDPNRFRFDGDDYHLRSRAELRRAFAWAGNAWIIEGFRNSLTIARDCHTRIPGWESRTWHIPSFPGVPDGYNAYSYLRKLAVVGLRGRGLGSDDRYVQRLRHELSLIRSTGIADFLLICVEQVQWARSQHIPVGPGRGSVGACLVAYLIGMTEIDPIRYNLRFERFLNPERPKMPDIDTDFSPKGRELVKAHLAELYGEDNVMPVAAYQTMKLRSTFRKLARSYGIEWSEINRLSKSLNPLDDDDEDDVSVLPEEIAEAYPDLNVHVQAMMGTRSALSQHPAGVLIFSPDDPIRELIPQVWQTNQKMLTAAFDLKSTEKIGLVKMDELGLRTLDTIAVCQRILRRMGVRVRPGTWVPDEEEDDKAVYAMLAEGRTAGVFQMEGGANTKGIVEIHCNCFEDVVSCTSLYRAGPIGAGAPQRYIRNKRSRKIRVAHPLLEPILKDSWGEMIYQEQMMDICHDIAGFNWAETDDVKETVRFKDPMRMATFKDRFINGCQTTSGIDPETAATIWAMIESQSTYLFNRVHAVEYSMITYRTARLKYLYPLEYFAAYLATVEADSDSHRANRQRVLAEAHEYGFKIMPPDVSFSETHMSCGANGTTAWLRFGLCDIKGIGPAKGAKLVEARQRLPRGFVSLADLDGVVDRRALDLLGSCGALASLGGSEVDNQTIEQYVDWNFDDRMVSWRRRLRNQIKLPGRDGSWTQIAGELIGVQRKTTRDGRPFRTWLLRWSPSETYSVTLWENCAYVWNVPQGSIVTVEGKWSTEWSNISVNDAEQIQVLQTHS